MRIKDTSVKINNLHPKLKEAIKELGLLHKEIMGNEGVITSGNDSVHWGGIKEGNRPFGWEDMTEKEVREFSDSKHYLDEAFDFRRRCPYGDKIYVDELSKIKYDQFTCALSVIFPKQHFDVVFSSACLHVEWDPKEPREHTPKVRMKKIKKITGLMKRLKSKEVEKPIFKRNGFKRKLGVVIGTIGAICCLIPEPTVQVVGQIIGALGTATTAIGGLDALKKNREKGESTYVDKNRYLRIVADILIKLIKQYFKKKG